MTIPGITAAQRSAFSSLALKVFHSPSLSVFTYFYISILAVSRNFYREEKPDGKNEKFQDEFQSSQWKCTFYWILAYTRYFSQSQTFLRRTVRL